MHAHHDVMSVWFQAAIAVILILVMSIYVAVTFRADLPRPLPTELSGSNYNGLASIAVMPISLACASVFRLGPSFLCQVQRQSAHTHFDHLQDAAFPSLPAFRCETLLGISCMLASVNASLLHHRHHNVPRRISWLVCHLAL